MTISQAQLTERLDSLEQSLPSIPSRTVAFGRATARRTTDIATSIIGEVGNRLGNASDAVTTATKTTTGQARSAAERSATAVRNGVAETTGQAAAQASRAVDAIEHETAELIDSAAKATDPATHNPASLDDLTKSELYDRAQALDIDGRSSMTKSQLVTALRA